MNRVVSSMLGALAVALCLALAPSGLAQTAPLAELRDAALLSGPDGLRLELEFDRAVDITSFALPSPRARLVLDVNGALAATRAFPGAGAVERVPRQYEGPASGRLELHHERNHL